MIILGRSTENITKMRIIRFVSASANKGKSNAFNSITSLEGAAANTRNGGGNNNVFKAVAFRERAALYAYHVAGYRYVFNTVTAGKRHSGNDFTACNHHCFQG